jgi:hypothetical protein
MARHRPLEEWLGIALSKNGSATPSRGMARHRPLEEWLGIALSRNGSASLIAPAGGIKKSKQGLSRVPAELKKQPEPLPKNILAHNL